MGHQDCHINWLPVNGFGGRLDITSWPSSRWCDGRQYIRQYTAGQGEGYCLIFPQFYEGISPPCKWKYIIVPKHIFPGSLKIRWMLSLVMRCENWGRIATLQANVGGWTRCKYVFTRNTHMPKTSFNPHNTHKVSILIPTLRIIED